MLEQLHLAVQYLATAGKSFLEHKADDSHTNVSFETDTETLETWPLHDSGLKLVFDIMDFGLQWSDPSMEKLLLDGKTHVQIVDWLTNSAKKAGLDSAYSFDLHYDLPFSWNDDYIFQVTDRSQLQQLSNLRSLAQQVIHGILEEEQLASDVRIWPHHFDTGAFAPLQDSDIAIGFGLAIPDSIVDDHYFYISGYQGHHTVDVSDFAPLIHGQWKNPDFNGAVLPARAANIVTAIQFFKEAIKTYRT